MPHIRTRLTKQGKRNKLAARFVSLFFFTEAAGSSVYRSSFLDMHAPQQPKVELPNKGLRPFFSFFGYLLSTCRLHTNGGCGKRESHIYWAMVMERHHPLLVELPWGLLALCRRILGSECHRFAIARPDKLGTGPISYGGLNK